MKKIINLGTICTVVIGLFIPMQVKSQILFGQGSSSNGYSSTTIYIPSVETTTSTTIEQINSSTDPNHNSVTTSTITTSSDGGFPIYHHRQDRQPTIILQRRNIYPRAVQSTCSTLIIGSPIPSPIALDRSGQPCH